MTDKKKESTPSTKTDWSKLAELQRQFEDAMQQVKDGAKKVNEGLKVSSS